MKIIERIHYEKSLQHNVTNKFIDDGYRTICIDSAFPRTPDLITDIDQIGIG